MQSLHIFIKNKKNMALVLSFCLFLAIAHYSLPVFALSEVPVIGFPRNLMLGSTGQDVKLLQQILNSSPDTQIASFGVGSPGQETTYFGQKTRIAVIKLQNKYKSEILTPYGIPSGTGFVGSATRVKLNALNVLLQGGLSTTSPSRSSSRGSVTFEPISNTSSNTLSTLNTTNTATVRLASGMKLYAATPFQVAPGGTITLQGTGITSDTLLYITDTVTASLSSDVSTSAKATIPASLAPGNYSIWLSNGKTNTRSQGFNVSLTVTNTPKAVPVITSVSPATITSLDTTITVTGTGFTANNSVVSGVGKISGLFSANGTTLTFKPSQLSESQKLQMAVDATPDGLSVPVDFHISNEQGVTQKAGTFKVQ
jgi:hypothetical protein